MFPRLENVSVSYRCGETEYKVDALRTVENEHLVLNIEMRHDGFSAAINAKIPIEIISFKSLMRYEFKKDSRIFLNGYQSWTDSTEHGVNDKMRGINGIPKAIVKKYSFSQYGDYTFTDYGKKSGTLHGYTYGYIKNGKDFDFIGSLNESCGFTLIRTDTKADTVTLEKDCCGLMVNGFYGGIDAMLLSGDENRVFDGYFEKLGIAKNPAVKPIHGYTSWYRHYQDISEEKILSDLKALSLSKQKAEVFQIDDGYQTSVGDWLSVDEKKFPHGMKFIADSISQDGYIPGIWLAPFVCEENSAVFRERKSFLLYDESGKPVKGGSNWSGFYALDLYNNEVREYIRNVLSTVVNEWGYRLLKLDFLYAACIVPRKDKTRGEIMFDAMNFIRECTRGALILGCGVPLAPAFGNVDYCRIGCDVSLDWNDKWYMRKMHRERTSTRNSILNSVFRRQLDGRGFLNDPDVFLLRSDNTRLSEKQKRCLAEVNAMTGSVLFTSDNVGTYGDKQREILADMEDLENAKIVSADIKGRKLIITYSMNNVIKTKEYSI